MILAIGKVQIVCPSRFEIGVDASGTLASVAFGLVIESLGPWRLRLFMCGGRRMRAMFAPAAVSVEAMAEQVKGDKANTQNYPNPVAHKPIHGSSSLLSDSVVDGLSASFRLSMRARIVLFALENISRQAAA
jgi:hypothetical protein